MIGRVAIVALTVSLAGCAGLEPAGRNAARSPSSAPPARAESPAPPPAQTAPGQQTVAPTLAPAQQQVAPPPAAAQAEETQTARAQSPDDDVVVPGQVRPLPQPPGDPRTSEERIRDIRAWDQCVMQVQGAFDADPMSPQLTTPEEYCAQSLGMADRTAVPVGRQQRRR